VCTQSGHVYVRSRKFKGSGASKPFRFQRIPHIQRVVAVCTNSTGAFGALRVDYRPIPIHVVGTTLEADMAAIAPYMRNVNKEKLHASIATAHVSLTEDDVEGAVMLNDIKTLTNLISVLNAQLRNGSGDRGTPVRTAHGADVAIRIGTGVEVPTHKLVLASRCKPLQAVLTHNSTLEDTHSGLTISFQASPTSSPFLGYLLVAGVSPLSFLILLHYLYSDDILTPWDRRIGAVFSEQFEGLGISPAQVKVELTALAGILELPQLSLALGSMVKYVPVSTLRRDYEQLYDQAQSSYSLLPRRDTQVDALAPDVALHLSDKVVYTNSVILRARCPFFSAFFGDPEWTVRRRDHFGVIDVRMGHLEWKIMQFVLKFICFGEEKLFDALGMCLFVSTSAKFDVAIADTLDTVDEVIDLVFRVLAAAVRFLCIKVSRLFNAMRQNEFLLTRLVLICSEILLSHLSPSNACSLLSDAIHYNAVELARSIESYMAANLEMFLESRILDDLETTMVRHLAEYTRREQLEKSPITRSNKLASYAMDKHKEWLALQDIPGPFVPRSRISQAQRESQKALRSVTQTPTPSPSLGPTRPSRSASHLDLAGDELFVMDDAESGTSLDLNVFRPSSPVPPRATCTPRPVWKVNPSASRCVLSECASGIIADGLQCGSQGHHD